MALTLSHIGPVGMRAPYDGKFWFSNSQRKCSQLSQTYTVSPGDYLVTWRGELKGGSAAGVVLINSIPLSLRQVSNTSKVGGSLRVYNATSIMIRGTGDAAFTEDPEVIRVRFG